MKQVTIQAYFTKANPRLVNSLDQDQHQQAIDQFRILYQQEMSRVRAKVQHEQKIQKNLQQKERMEERTKQQIQSTLKERMQMHFKKREQLQLQKLKNYRRVDVQWRERVKTIASQVKERQKQNALHSNRLSKDAVQFWESKEEKRRTTPIKHQEPRYFSHDPTANLRNDAHSHFLTQANIITPNQSPHRDQEYSFPSIQQASRMRGVQGSRSVAIERDKSQLIREHLLKSSELWREKEGLNFQKVMQKLDQIEKTRNKVRQKIANDSQRMRQIRLHKDSSHQQRFFNMKKQECRHSGSSSFAVNHPPLKNYRYDAVESDYQSMVEKRRNERLDTDFQERGRHFELELRKEKRGGYRKMVKDVINAVKLQALKQPQSSVMKGGP